MARLSQSLQLLTYCQTLGKQQPKMMYWVIISSKEHRQGEEWCHVHRLWNGSLRLYSHYTHSECLSLLRWGNVSQPNSRAEICWAHHGSDSATGSIVVGINFDMSSVILKYQMLRDREAISRQRNLIVSCSIQKDRWKVWSGFWTLLHIQFQHTAAKIRPDKWLGCLQSCYVTCEVRFPFCSHCSNSKILVVISSGNTEKKPLSW